MNLPVDFRRDSNFNPEAVKDFMLEFEEVVKANDYYNLLVLYRNQKALLDLLNQARQFALSVDNASYQLEKFSQAMKDITLD